MKKKTGKAASMPTQSTHLITLELSPVAYAMVTILADNDGYANVKDAFLGLMASNIASLFEHLGKDDDGQLKVEFGVEGAADPES